MIQVNISNRAAYTIIAITLILLVSGITIAYRSDQIPSVLGHSAEELEVNVSGAIMTLQQAINSHVLGGSAGTLTCQTITRTSTTGDAACAGLGAGWVCVSTSTGSQYNSCGTVYSGFEARCCSIV